MRLDVVSVQYVKMWCLTMSVTPLCRSNSSLTNLRVSVFVRASLIREVPRRMVL